MILQNGKRIDGCTDTVPVGTLQPFLGLVPPKGYLACQGQMVSKITYSELYEICGDTFGVSTETHFYLPDLRGKTLAGYDADDNAMNTIGKLLGQKTHTHTSAAHTHSVAGHTHTSAAHTHSVAGHTHTSAAHSHTSAAHSHSTGNHTLTVTEIPAHQHYVQTFPYQGSDGTYYCISPSPGYQVDPGTHWRGGFADYTGGSGAHNHGNTGSTTPGNTGSTTPGATGSTSLTTNSTTPGATGSTSLTTNSTSPDDTGSNTNYQPTITVNWIVKAIMLIPNYIIVEDVLTSNSATDALSARQGKLLNEKFADYATKSEMIQYLPLSGGTLTGKLYLGQGDANSLHLGTDGRINTTIGTDTNVTVLGILDNYISVGTTVAPLNFRGSGASPHYNKTPLIESGSNSNGTYTKFFDGTMICRCKVTKTVTMNTAYGNVYGANFGGVTFPATFTDIPVVSWGSRNVGNSRGYWVGTYNGITISTTGISGIHLFRHNENAEASDIEIHITAIGSWK